MKIENYIEDAKKGNQAAFTALMDFYWNEVFNFVAKRTENEADAEDISIEAFAKAFDKIKTYNNEFQFNTWIITIAKNTHVDWARKQKRNYRSDWSDKEENEAYAIADDTPTAEDVLIIEQNLKQLLRYIKELKPAYQEVIQLRYFQEMSYQEMSNQLNEPLNNVKVKLLRAKKLLSQIIAKQ